MTWVRIQDEMPDHPKLARAGPLGLALYVAGLCYCNRHLTDGFIPRAKAENLLGWTFYRDEQSWRIGVTSGVFGEDVDSKFVISMLCDSGLWDEEDGGFRVHDYLEHQTSRQEVTAKREAVGRRVKKHRNATCNAVTSAFPAAPEVRSKKAEVEEESKDVASSTSLRSVESALPSEPADQQAAVRSLIVGLAACKDAKEAHKPPDPLAAVWEWCKANVATSERTAVMKFTAWLQKTGTTDPDILLALVKHYVVHRPANGFAYYAKTGQARAIIANRVRNDAEIIAHEQRKAESAAFFGQSQRRMP